MAEIQLKMADFLNEIFLACGALSVIFEKKIAAEFENFRPHPAGAWLNLKLINYFWLKI